MRAKPSELRLLNNRLKGSQSAALLRRRALGGLIIGALLIPALPASAEIVVDPTTGPTEETTPTDFPSTDAPTETSVAPATEPVSESPENVATTSIIVKMVGGLDSEAQDAVIARHGGVETSTISALQLHVVDVPTADLDAVIASYRSDADVANVSLDRTREVEGAASDPGYGSQWALPQIGWDQVHGVADLSGSVKIAVLDTGVAAIDEFEGRLGAGYSAFGTNPTNDVNGHGTQMASIAAAATNNDAGIAGVAYGDVTVIPVQVLDANGEGSDSDIIEGLVWAVDSGADVALMAFSNPGYSAALQDAISYAWYNGVVVVAAAGNDGSTSATYPAGSSKVIGVGGSTSSDTLWSGSNQSAAVYLTAPAVGISAVDTNGDVVSVSGTSASAAIVAGAAAVLRGIDGAASPSVIVGRLARNADPLVDGTLGNGRVNLARAAADESIEGVIPMGVTGGGGPVVGPYVIAGGGTLTGTVTNSSGGAGISGATVSCSAGCTSSNTVVTGSDGTFSIASTWTGNASSTSTVTLRATAPGFTANTSASRANVGSSGATGMDVALTADATAPVVSSINRVGGEFLKTGSTATWEITFSEDVSGVDKTDFALAQSSGTCSSGGPTLGDPTTVSTSVYRITSSVGSSGDCVLGLNLIARPSITDVDTSKPLYGPFVGQGFTVDRTVPTATITRVTSEASNLASVSWTVTFSEPVSDVDSSDFTLSATGLVGTSISSVAVDGGGAQPATTFTVAASSGTGSGTLGLNISGSRTINDRAGNAMTASPTGPTYTFDRTPPSVSSVTRVGAASRNTAAVSWTVTFSKSVTGVDASDFAASITSGDLVIGSLSVTGSGAAYTVSGSRTSGQGTVRLDVSNDGTIEDANGLDLSAAFTSGDTITYDSVVPTVSIARVSNEFVNTGPVTWELTFSEVVTGLDLSDFSSVNVSGSCTGGSTPALGTLAQQSDLTKWRVSSPIGNNGSCVLVASLVASPSVSDSAGNALAGPVTGQTITVDRAAPDTSSIVRVGSSPTAASSVSWTVTFNEPVSGVAAADFGLATSGVSGAAITNVAIVGGGSEPATSYTVTASTGTGSGTLGLNIANTRTINDRAGNAMSTTLTGQTYTLDRAAPRVTSINRAESSPTSASTASWTVVFTKAVSGVDTSDFQLVQSGVSGATISSVVVSGGGSEPATTFVVAASTGTGSGTLGLDLVDDNSIVDDASQALVGASAEDGSFTGQLYTFDREAPAVSSITRLDPSPTSANSVRWTVTFSENVNGVNAADFSTTTTGSVVVGTPTVTGTAGGSSYTVSVSVTSGEGTVSLNVLDDDSIVDIGTLNALGGTGTGNGAFEGTDSAYTVDKTAPVTLSIQRYDPTTLYSSKQDVQWLVTFSESVSAVDAGDFVLTELDSEFGNAPRIRGEAVESVTPLSGSGPTTQWLVTVDTGRRNGALCLGQKVDNRAEIVDVAGNKIATAYTCVENDRFIVAKDAPYVLSITRNLAEPNTKADTVSWTVVFSEPVGGDQTSDGVTADDFLLASIVSGVLTDGVAGVGIATPVAVNPAPDANGVSRATTWTITGTLTGLNEGQVLLVLKDNDSIVNSSEIELRSSISTATNNNIDGTYRLGESYTIDRTAPAVSVDSIGLFDLDKTYRPADVVGNRGVLSSDISSVTLEYFEGKTIDSGEVPVETDEDGRSTSTWKSVVSNNELDQGWYTVRVSQSDKAGNIGVVEKTFLVDDVKPTIAFTENGLPDSLTNEKTQSWNVEFGDGEDPDASGINGIVCSLNGATYGPCPTGSPSAGISIASTDAGITVDIAEGCNTFDIRVYDNAGNATTISWDGLLDTVAPIVSLISPADETYTNDVTPQVTGNGGVLANVGGCGFSAPNEDLGSPSVDNDVVVLKLFEGQLTEAEIEASSSSLAGTFELDLVSGVFDEEIPVVAAEVAIASGLAEGWYSLRAEQVDEAGNIGYSDVVWFLVDTTKPTVDFTVVKPDAETKETTAPFEFDRSDLPGAGERAVASAFDAEDSFALCRLDNGEWLPCDEEETFLDEVTITSNNEGPHTLDVKVVDRAGNVSDVETYEWLIDITSPDVEITSAPTNPTIITGSNATSPSLFTFVANDPDPDFETAETDGPAIPSEVEEMLCKLDAGSFMDCDSFTGQMYNPLAIGRHTFTVKSVDGAGNESEAEHVWDIQANRTVLYTGSYLVTKPGTIGLAATITSAATECKSGIEVSFIVKLDGGEKFAGTAMSNSSGVATLTTPSTTNPNWPEGVYDIEINIPMSEDCTGATDQGSVTVASLGSAATGGGHYTSSGIGRVNFGLSINRVPNTSPAQFRGQVLIQNNGKWRLKGSINNYVKMTTTSGLRGSASGVGTLQKWDDSIGAWVAVATNVAFSVIFEDNGSRRGIDKFTVNNIAYRPEGLTLGAKWLPTSTAEGLKGGDVRIT